MPACGVIAIGNTRCPAASRASQTAAALIHEIECSLLRPPKTNATVDTDMERTLAATGPGTCVDRYGHAMSAPHPWVDPATIAVTAGRPDRIPDAPLNTPIVPASAFIAGGDIEYARDGGPTLFAFETVVAALEAAGDTGQAVAFASGMAAADAVLDLVPLGGRVIAPTTTYTGVAVRLRELHDRGSLVVELVDVTDTAAVQVAIERGADLLWLESPTNPLLEIADLPTLLGSARSRGIRTVVDNTFATPIGQQPLTLGADVVMHSATKALSGHSDLLMGVLVTNDQERAAALRTRRTLLGAAPSPFDAYLATRGLRTLPLRHSRARESAEFLAGRLSAQSAISRVRSFGSMLTIEFGGDVELADRLCGNTHLWVHATSLGGVESTLERRRRWPLEADHVPPDLVRLSVGIENPEDLWRDLAGALNAS